MADRCNVPPEGWACTRAANHAGPCAAVPDARHQALSPARGEPSIHETGQFGMAAAYAKTLSEQPRPSAPEEVAIPAGMKA